MSWENRFSVFQDDSNNNNNNTPNNGGGNNNNGNSNNNHNNNNNPPGPQGIDLFIAAVRLMNTTKDTIANNNTHTNIRNGQDLVGWQNHNLFKSIDLLKQAIKLFKRARPRRAYQSWIIKCFSCLGECDTLIGNAFIRNKDYDIVLMHQYLTWGAKTLAKQLNLIEADGRQNIIHSIDEKAENTYDAASGENDVLRTCIEWCLGENKKTQIRLETEMQRLRTKLDPSTADRNRIKQQLGLRRWNVNKPKNQQSDIATLRLQWEEDLSLLTKLKEDQVDTAINIIHTEIE